ncbi:MAG: DUF1579 domain-containing protein, partial [Planctomycetota bacterium]
GNTKANWTTVAARVFAAEFPFLPKPHLSFITMRTHVITTVLFLAIALGGLTQGQIHAQDFAPAKPTQQHKWLKQFLGSWKSSSKSDAKGDQPATEMKGTMTATGLGDLWIIIKQEGKTPDGGTFQAQMTIGYDEKKKEFTGTWVDSMMNHMWKYQGQLDDSGKKLMLVAEGPNFIGDGSKTTFRDSYEFKSADLIIAKSEMKSDDGEWTTMMVGEVHRVKETSAPTLTPAAIKAKK